MYAANNYFPENDLISANVKIHVYNLRSPRTDSPAKNQFAIRFSDYVVFQSYETTCLKYDYTCEVLTVFPEAFGYSTTTSKYSRAFLMDELGLDESEVNEIKKIVKSSDFGRDCPLYIQF